MSRTSGQPAGRALARCPDTPGLEAARARGRAGGRKPKLTARQITIARQMYDDTGADNKRKYAVNEIAEAFPVSRKTIYRHLDRYLGSTTSTPPRT